MNSLTWNFIEVNIVIALLFLGFLLIRNRLAFVQQRAVLIGIPFLSVIAIVLKSIVDFSAVSYAMPLVELEPFAVGQANNAVATGEFSLSLAFFYGIGALCIGLLFVFRLFKLGLFFARNNSENKGKYRIYRVEGKSSFSFFNRIQITPDLSGEEQEIVLEHEKMHVDKWHSFDTIIIELLHIAFWFNPVFFFIKRELINLHEFEVDAVMYKKHKVSYMKFLVNYALGLTTSNYLLTSRFYNQLTLKKRIKIMKTESKKRSGLLLLLPLIALTTVMVQCEKINMDEGAELSSGSIEMPEKSYVEVDVNPEFVGGQEAMMNFMIENIKYPESAYENEVQGIVYVQFVISSTGEVTNCEVVRPVDPDLDAEALRVVKAMPDWTPGEKDGKKVGVRYTLPINFRLD